MRNNIIAFILFTTALLSVKAQDNERDGRLITDGAYTKKIGDELSYLLLGESSPQQGLGFTLNEDGSNLKLNGLLKRTNEVIWTLEGDFSSTNGVYFFDEENGGRKAEIGLNVFWNIKELKPFTGSTYMPDEEEVFNAKNLKIERILKEYAGKFNSLYNVLNEEYPEVVNNKIKPDSSIKLPTNKENYNKVIEILGTLFEKYNIGDYDVDEVYNFDLTSYQTKNQKFQKVYILDEQDATIAISYKLDKVYEEYVKASEHIRTKLEDELYGIEDKITDNQWSKHEMFFVGLNLSYERESFKRFTFDENLAFEKMFNDERGNRLGAEISLNWLYDAKNNYSFHKPNNLFVKGTFGIRRASNFSTFSNTTLSSESVIGEDINGMEITRSSTDSAFIGADSYETGTGTSISLDVYYFPYKEIALGAFVEVKHEYIDFKDDTGVSDIQLSPLRAGLLYNFKNTEKDKPIVTLSLFMDRTDLSKDPNGDDNDLRFGIGIGLPINLK